MQEMRCIDCASMFFPFFICIMYFILILFVIEIWAYQVFCSCQVNETDRCGCSTIVTTQQLLLSGTIYNIHHDLNSSRHDYSHKFKFYTHKRPGQVKGVS